MLVQMDALSRTREDVDCTLQNAKLDTSELHKTAQCLYMSADLDNDAMKLIEMDNSLLDSLLAGNCLSVRGLKSDSAVLCTNDESFEVKEAETSNSLLLLPECQFSAQSLNCCSQPSAVSRQVCALKKNYFELRRTKPRLRRLKECLEEAPYAGETFEADNTAHRYTFSELLDMVQASEVELRQALIELNACVIHGCWRMLDFDYTSSVLSSILSAKDEFTWSTDCIPAAQLSTALLDLYPSFIVQHVLQCFAEQSTSSSDDSSSDESVYSLNEAKVCRFYAELLLRTANKYHLQDFEATWQMSVPDGMTTQLSYLEGLALVDRSVKPEIISYFPVHELPEDVTERFQLLFKTKEKWTLEELIPYVECLCVEGSAGVGTLLTKHARVSSQKGVKVYSARK